MGSLWSQLALFSHLHVWAIYLAHCCYNYARYFIFSWMPIFYTSILGVSSAETGFHLIWPEITGVIAGWFSKSINVWLRKLGLSPLASRRVVSCGAFALQSLILSYLALLLWGEHTWGEPVPWVVTVLLCLHSGLLACHGGGFKATYLDVSQKNAGLLCGVGNTFATIPGYIGP